MFFLYDHTTQTITSFINVITGKQSGIRDYVTKTYSTVKVTVEGTWMRLDFDDDGSVSMDDLKLSMVSFYNFLMEFDAIDASYQVKGKLYTDAIAYMQQELEQDQKQREIRSQEKKDGKEDDGTNVEQA